MPYLKKVEIFFKLKHSQAISFYKLSDGCDFVYIIYSVDFDKYYKGYSGNPYKRLSQHNNKESRYTSKFTPWKLIYVEELDTKQGALRREKSLKKYSKEQLKEVINSSKNILRE